MPTSDIRQNEHHVSTPRARGSRALLLGTVAAVAFGGGVANEFMIQPARAGASLSQQVTPTSAPASFADVIERVKGAVVSVQVKLDASARDDEAASTPDTQPGDPLERFFKRFGDGQGPMGRGRRPQGGGQALGSGFIISADGYVVTNNHVVEKASEVHITLDDGRTLPAKLIGADKKTDLALLKISKPGTYKYVEFGATVPRVGDWVMAVGNPFGLGGTVTAGIVSARGRDIGAGPYDDFLQIDAPVNRGNSGGPTFDTSGNVVGVNTAIVSPSGGSVGIGFAIPAEVAKSVVASLKDKGTVARGYIGVQIQPVTQDIADSLGLKSTNGVLVADAKTGPAADAGIQSGDVITAVNGEKVNEPRELSRRIAALGPEKKVELTYERSEVEKSVNVRLGALPAEREAKASEPQTEDRKALAALGLELAPAASLPGAGKEGVVVADIDPNGIGAQKGLRTGDVILEAAGKSVSRPEEIVSAVANAKKEGQKAVLLRVKTGDATHFVAIATTAAS